MKRALIIVPLVLLVLLNACDTDRLPPLSDKQWAAIAQTEQVRNKTPEEKLRYWLITVPPAGDRIDGLEQALVAKYEIRNVSLPPPYFLVEIHCQCMSGSCCHAKEMLIVLLRRIADSQFRNQIVAEVDNSSVQYLDLVTYDEVSQLAAIYAPWDLIRRFLQGSVPPSDLVNQIQEQKLR